RRRFALPTNFLRPAGPGFHIFDRIADHDPFRIVAGMAGVACGCSTRLEIRLSWKRRSAVGQTRARLARDQRDRAHAYLACCGRTRSKKFFADAGAPTWLRTARSVQCPTRVAVENVFGSRENRDIYQSTVRQSQCASG